MVASICLALGLVGPLTPGLAHAQAVITPTTAAGDSIDTARGPERSIDRSGLTDPGTPSDELDDTNSDARNDNWGDTTTGASLTLTLPRVSTIDSVFMWNGNEGGYGSRAVDHCDFLFSIDGGSSYGSSTNLGFAKETDTVQTNTFPMQTGVTHVMLTNFVSYDATYVYIGEIRFGGPIALESPSADNISYDSARLNATLSVPSTNATVHAYWWKPGDSVTNSALVGAWTNVISTNISYTIPTTPGLSQGTNYTFSFRATNDTAETWSAVSDVFTTIFDGELLAEYVFDGSLASTDGHADTTASNVTYSGADSYATVLQFNGTGASYPGGEYFSFTLNTEESDISLTGIMWDWGMESGYGIEAGLFSDAYQGFGGGAEIPGTYTNTADVVTTVSIDTHTVNLSGLTEFQDLTSTSVVFRVYLSDNSSSSTRYYRYDNIRVYGTVAASTAGTVFSFK